MPKRYPEALPCAITDCTEPAHCRGWCGAHYQRWRRFGDPEYHPPAPRRACSVDGCDEPPNARQLCRDHYYFWHRYGDPLYRKNRDRVTPVIFYPPRACLTCGRIYDPGRSTARKYCSAICKPSGWIARSVNKRVWVEKLGNEDGWSCWICEQPVDKALYWPALQAGSVDHIIPVKQHGTDERSNLRLAHLACNLARRTTPKAA